MYAANIIMPLNIAAPMRGWNTPPMTKKKAGTNKTGIAKIGVNNAARTALIVSSENVFISQYMPGLKLDVDNGGFKCLVVAELKSQQVRVEASGGIVVIRVKPQQRLV